MSFGGATTVHIQSMPRYSNYTDGYDWDNYIIEINGKEYDSKTAETPFDEKVSAGDTINIFSDRRTNDYYVYGKLLINGAEVSKYEYGRWYSYIVPDGVKYITIERENKGYYDYAIVSIIITES